MQQSCDDIQILQSYTRGDGIARAKKLPFHWSTTSILRWRSQLKLRTHP